MINRSLLKGIVPPIVTPFEDDGHTVSVAGVDQLVERLIGQGVHGMFPGGSTGEMWALDDGQWERLVAATVRACAGRVPVYAGVSHPSTAGAIARARRAEALGADVIVSLAPYYIPPSQPQIMRHFQALAEATSLPVLIYQFPAIVKTSISLETYQALADCPNIVGAKDSQADITEFRQMADVLRDGGRDFRLFLGSDSLTDVAVLVGGQGTVPSLGNLAAAALVRSYEAAVAGAWPESVRAQAEATALKAVYAAAGGAESGFQGVVAGIKCALNLLGVRAGPPAPPLRPCSEAETAAIAAILRGSGLLA